MPSRARAGNLTAALALVSFLELVLNRLANRLFLPRSLLSGAAGGSSAGARLLGQAGPFLFHLTNVLALLIFVAAFAGLLRRRELYPRAIRFTATVIAAVFSALTGLGIFFGQQPPPFFFHAATTSYGFLSLLTLLAVLGARVGWRAKVGVALFTLPGLLHVTSLALERTGVGAGGTLVGDLSWWGEACLLLAAASAPLTLPPERARQRAWIVPGAVAAGVATVFAVALGSHHDLVAAAALFGLRLEMPDLTSAMGAAYVVAAFGWTLAFAQLLAAGGGARLAGYGVLLLAVAGYQIGAPPELTVALLGVLALSIGELRASPAAAGEAALADGAGAGSVKATDWRTYVGRVAAAATDGSGPAGAPPEAVVVDDDDLEVSRVRGHRRGRPVSLRFLRRRGQVVEFEVSVGEPGHQEPQATIERRRGWLARAHGGGQAPLPASKTGDPAFDQAFRVRGQAPLASEGLRQQVMRQGAGVLSLWRGGAARYQAHRNGRNEGERGDPPFVPAFGGVPPISAHTDDMVAMLDTLIDLVEIGSGSGSGAA
jgi:hypothetical protein